MKIAAEIKETIEPYELIQFQPQNASG